MRVIDVTDEPPQPFDLGLFADRHADYQIRCSACGGHPNVDWVLRGGTIEAVIWMTKHYVRSPNCTGGKLW
jgi:hypothetical protein